MPLYFDLPKLPSSSSLLDLPFSFSLVAWQRKHHPRKTMLNVYGDDAE